MATSAFKSVSMLDPYWLQQREIERRRRIAEALQAQATEPIQAPATPPGGFTVPIQPTQGLAKIMQALMGGWGERQAEEETKSLGERYTKDRASVIAEAMKAGEARPAQTIQPDPQEAMQAADFGTPEVPPVNIPAMPQNRERLYEALARNTQFPDLQSVGLAGLPKERVVPRGATVLGPDNKPIYTSPYETEHETFGEPYQMGGAWVQKGSRGTIRQAVPRESERRETAETFGEPYQMGGAWVQKGSRGTIRQAVPREPLAPQVRITQPEPLVQIMGPNGPQWATRSQAVGATPAGAGSRAEKVEEGKTLLKTELDNLRTDYALLQQRGAIPSSSSNAASNAISWLQSSGAGQLAGRIFGTEEQDARNRIQSARLRVLNAIKNATGMTAQQLNSNIELQTWLKSLTDPSNTYETNIGIIDAIDQIFIHGGQAPTSRASQGQIRIPDMPPPGAVRRK